LIMLTVLMILIILVVNF